MQSDPVSDMLTRIRNAGMAQHAEVVLPSSKMKLAIANVLTEEAYIEEAATEESASPQPKTGPIELYCF